MAKNVCIFSDGTGQGGSVKNETNSNVFRLCRAAHLADPTETRQTCFYDPGLGWERGRTKRGSWRWVYDTLSQATGLGISQNLRLCLG